MLRPRNYSVLNRSIARGISYALRDNNRKKSKTIKSNTYTNSSNNQNTNITTENTFLSLFALFVFLGLIVLPCLYPEVLVIYFIIFILILIGNN